MGCAVFGGLSELVPIFAASNDVSIILLIRSLKRWPRRTTKLLTLLAMCYLTNKEAQEVHVLHCDKTQRAYVENTNHRASVFYISRVSSNVRSVYMYKFFICFFDTEVMWK